MNHKLLEVKNLTQYFGSPSNPIKAVDGISFHIFEGETIAITPLIGKLKLHVQGYIDQ